ncbi:hypothetical protein NVP1038O_70 [Vibrio phage 1.038.O._10N.286.51.C2]|nr:hypothetical protein NVP1038O_70 [Vibrio phage 1.038.O._10N.286.51.C2]
MKSKANQKHNGLPKATYYRRLKEWTLTLYDKDGKAYHVNPKMVMEKGNEN